MDRRQRREGQGAGWVWALEASLRTPGSPGGTGAPPAPALPSRSLSWGCCPFKLPRALAGPHLNQACHRPAPAETEAASPGTPCAPTGTPVPPTLLAPVGGHPHGLDTAMCWPLSNPGPTQASLFPQHRGQSRGHRPGTPAPPSLSLRSRTWPPASPPLPPHPVAQPKPLPLAGGTGESRPRPRPAPGEPSPFSVLHTKPLS